MVSGHFCFGLGRGSWGAKTCRETREPLPDPQVNDFAVRVVFKGSQEETQCFPFCLVSQFLRHAPHPVQRTPMGSFAPLMIEPLLCCRIRTSHAWGTVEVCSKTIPIPFTCYSGNPQDLEPFLVSRSLRGDTRRQGTKRDQLFGAPSLV